MTKRYFRVDKGTGYTFDKQVVGKVFEAVAVGDVFVSLSVGLYGGIGVWSFEKELLTEVTEILSFENKPEEVKKVASTKQKPPAPKQRKLNIRYVSGQSYHLKNVIDVVVDTQTSQLHVNYKHSKDGIEFITSVKIPFSELTAVNFQDKVSKVSVGYSFSNGELVHCVEHFETKPQPFYH